MSKALALFQNLIQKSAVSGGFLDVVFGDTLAEARAGRPVVLFGAGAFGQELSRAIRKGGISPVAFCDNDEQRIGKFVLGTPVISFSQLKDQFKDSLVVIASRFHSDAIISQLASGGFAYERILCKPKTLGNDLGFFYLYSIGSTTSIQANSAHWPTPSEMLDIVHHDSETIEEVYELFEDEWSKALFIARLAYMASGESFSLFKYMIGHYSEPVIEFGSNHPRMPSEEHYYFNKPILDLADGEIYLDIGAADGDTVKTFLDECVNRRIKHGQIFAFEPDPDNFKQLKERANSVENIVCINQGVWSSSGILNFRSSRKSIHAEAAAISEGGDIQIMVNCIDELTGGHPFTLIKIDPGGDIIPDIIRGAERTISAYGPKIICGVYHGFDSLYKIPLQIRKLRPAYKLFLRHNAYHANETHLYAM